MKISDNLREMCKEENEVIIENEKIEEERRKFIKMGISPNKETDFLFEKFAFSILIKF